MECIFGIGNEAVQTNLIASQREGYRFALVTHISMPGPICLHVHQQIRFSLHDC